MAYVGLRRQYRLRLPTPEHWPFVSILVPAYNESANVESAIQSLLSLDYPRYEVVFVSDGSSDETFERARRFVGDYGHCSLGAFSKPNGGKWSALNFAFHRARGDLILCVDADSRLSPDGLRKLVVHMADVRVWGVAGQVRVRNRVNVLTCLQGLEYVVANGLIRLAQSLTGTVLVIPGPIGLFRRDALERIFQHFAPQPDSQSAGTIAGPFEGDTFAEDFDLSVAILSLGGRTVYEPGAIAFTRAPVGILQLLNQRYRWCRGTIQVVRKYFHRSREQPSLRQPRLIAWLAATHLLEIVFLPLLNALIWMVLIGFLAVGGDLGTLIPWIAAFVLINLNAAAGFIAVHGDSPFLLAVVPVYDIYQTFLLNSGWLIAVLDELRGRRMRW